MILEFFIKYLKAVRIPYLLLLIMGFIGWFYAIQKKKYYTSNLWLYLLSIFVCIDFLLRFLFFKTYGYVSTRHFLLQIFYACVVGGYTYILLKIFNIKRKYNIIYIFLIIIFIIIIIDTLGQHRKDKIWIKNIANIIKYEAGSYVPLIYSTIREPRIGYYVHGKMEYPLIKCEDDLLIINKNIKKKYSRFILTDTNLWITLELFNLTYTENKYIPIYQITYKDKILTLYKINDHVS